MNDWNAPAPTGLPRRVYVSIFAFLLILAAIYFTGGKKPDPAKKKQAGKTQSGAISDRECERRLQQALNGLHPERVVINSNRLDRVSELAMWGMECGHAENLSALGYDAAENGKWLTGDLLTRTNAPLYSERDAQHITIAKLCGEAAGRVASENMSPTARAVELFDFVVRQTLLEPDDASKAFLRTPLESLMLGRATAADRAWTFAVLLRQSQVDAVIVEPKSRPEAWLIGVLGPAGEVWLFDPRLGTALPGADDDGKETRVAKPATLSDVRGDASLLRKLDLEDMPYALQEGDLNEVSVRMIGESSTFSERMARVQVMSPGSGMNLFDGLGKSALQSPGLAERVVNEGGESLWKKEDVSVWTYPDEQLQKFMESGAEDSPAWKVISEIFAGPMVVNQKQEGENPGPVTVERMKSPLRRVRLLHLGQGPKKAIPLYGPIRLESRPPSLVPTDPDLLAKLQKAIPANMAAADFTIFWTALAQYEIGRGELAVTTLNQYLREYPLGSMREAVPELLAQSFALEGKLNEAVKVLDSIPAKARGPRLTWLLSRWKYALNGDAPAATEASPPESQPEETSPTQPTEEDAPKTEDQASPENEETPPASEDEPAAS